MTSLPTIHFEKATPSHQQMIFDWLEEPHMKEFWDNSQEHKDDILNFIHGRPQHHFCGTTKYWVGYVDDQLFCFVLSDEMRNEQYDLSDLHRAHLSKKGYAISLDFGIGNTAFLGKGLAARTLRAFVDFYVTNIDSKADVFFIDPNLNNPRAKHVYEKAGFVLVGEYVPKAGFFEDGQSLLLVRKM